MNFIGFLSMVIYVAIIYIHNIAIRYNICSAWLLDIRISTCLCFFYEIYNELVKLQIHLHYHASIIKAFPVKHLHYTLLPACVQVM